jgi:GTPase SAR1 family protein
VFFRDTAGQDRYRAITAAYYRNASGAFLVYDISRGPTFKSLDKWLEDLRSHVDPEVPIIVVGNKSDLREHREVTQDQAKAWCEQNCINQYLETSALDNTNVENAFLMLINAMVQQIETDCEPTNDPTATQLPSDVHKLTKDDIVKGKESGDGGNWCCGQ